jgi:hypothetical protein
MYVTWLPGYLEGEHHIRREMTNQTNIFEHALSAPQFTDHILDANILLPRVNGCFAAGLLADGPSAGERPLRIG